MSKRNQYPLITIAVIIGIIILLCVYYISSSKRPGAAKYYSSAAIQMNNTIPEIEHLDSLNGLISTKQSEIKQLKDEINYYEKGFLTFEGNTSSGLWIVRNRIFQTKGFISADSMDNSGMLLALNYLGINMSTKYFPYPKYRLYTKNNSTYLTALESKQPNKSMTVYNYSPFYKIKYSVGSKNNNVLLPIKNSFERVVITIVIYLCAIVGLLIYCFLITNTITLFITISKNKAFSDLNIFRLKWCGIGCFLIALVPYLINGIFYLIYFKEFYPEVSFTHSLLGANLKWIIAGITYSLLFITFRRGYKLQQEQALTI